MEGIVENKCKGCGRIIISPKKKYEENDKKAYIYKVSGEFKALKQDESVFIFHRLFPLSFDV